MKENSKYWRLMLRLNVQNISLRDLRNLEYVRVNNTEKTWNCVYSAYAILYTAHVT